MSFLNPVSESVKRFSSTDASAPQINYNARVAGDVKAVLKACLVTGYGAKASAGWSIVNEVDHVAEFVSPSAAMSDYRLGIDDTSTSTTTWYYQYQDARINPVSNALSKNFGSYIDKNHASNGWQLLVTQRGLYFVEICKHSGGDALVARMTYWGMIKSALVNNVGENIAWFAAGWGAPNIDPKRVFFDFNVVAHTRLSGIGSLKPASPVVELLRNGQSRVYGEQAIDLTAELYLMGSNKIAGLQQGLLLKEVAVLSGLYGVRDELVNNRPALYICLSREVVFNDVKSWSLGALVYLDYWEC